MKRTILWLMAVLVPAALAFAAQEWKASYPLKRKNLHFTSSGNGPYFILTPGYKIELDSAKVHDVLTVLHETKMIDGVETRVVEDRESDPKGNLEEVTRDYYAICVETGDLHYFGEEVDVYKKGKVVNHDGSWLSGQKGAKYGVALPAKPNVGMRYYEEKAPGVGMDRAEIVTLKEFIETKAGSFNNCLKVLGTSELEPNAKEYKLYAPGVGIVKDGEMIVTKYGFH